MARLEALVPIVAVAMRRVQGPHPRVRGLGINHLEKVEQEHRVESEHRGNDDREPSQVLLDDVRAALRMWREPEPTQPGLTARVHEYQRDQKGAQEHLDDGKDL